MWIAQQERSFEHDLAKEGKQRLFFTYNSAERRLPCFNFKIGKFVVLIENESNGIRALQILQGR